jgi:hypothetical protein
MDRSWQLAGVVGRIPWLRRMLMPLLLGIAVIGFSPVGAFASTPSTSAPGSVSCSVSGRVSFSPPLKTDVNLATSSTLNAHLSGCSTSASGVTIKSGRLVGSFAEIPLDCPGIPESSTPLKTGTATWKGIFDGKRVTFTPTEIAGTAASGDSASGSFAGPATLNVTTRSFYHIGAHCARRGGVKSAPVVGTLTLGSA